MIIGFIMVKYTHRNRCNTLLTGKFYGHIIVLLVADFFVSQQLKIGAAAVQ